MNICSTCLDVSQRMYTEYYQTNLRVGDWPNLQESKDECDLCRLVYDNIKEDHNYQQYLHTLRAPLLVNSRRSILPTENNRFCAPEFFIQRCLNDFEMSIWADEDSAASAKIITQPPILYDNAQSIAPTVSYMLNDCKSSHHDCNEAIDGDGCAQLPTRVLHVSSTSGVLSVKLVERGGVGDYCSLSHCWGSSDKRPLTTTRANLADHLEGIPFSNLPKTFQDAIMLVHKMGIAYIWIDSLCIIQDDEADWSSEAKRMAKIYSNATIVIAAANSRDSTEGLFVTKRPDPVVVKVPFISGGKIVDHFYVSARPRGILEPVLGHLRTRAWAFQEWYLSKRLITFMPGGMLWKCKTVQVNERGSKEDARTYEDSSWLDLIKQYITKELSFESDRLYALHGIVAKEHSDRKGRFFFEYGVWEEHILEEIMWARGKSPLSENGQKLPSWSWASLTGARLWPLELPGSNKWTLWYTNSHNLKPDSGTLTVPGYFVRSTLKFCTSLPVDYFSFPGGLTCTASGLAFLGHQYCAIYLGDDKDDHVGIAIFDMDFPASSQCLILASTVKGEVSPTEKRSPLSQPGTSSYEAVSRKEQNPTSDPEGKSTRISATIYTVDESNVLLKGSSSKKQNFDDSPQDEEQDKQQVETELPNEKINPAGKHAEAEYTGQPMEDNRAPQATVLTFWGLLVTPIGDGTYKRVGMGLIYPKSFEQMDVAYGEVRIR